MQDAAFIYGLRVDPELSRYLSPVTGGVEDQAAWNASYKSRKATGSEAYYNVEAPNRRPCGTVRLDNIWAGTFTWGSFILNKEKRAKAALDVAISVYDISFGSLNCTSCHFDVRLENTGVIEFHRRLGAIEYDRTDLDVLMRYDPTTFSENRPRLEDIVRHANE